MRRRILVSAAMFLAIQPLQAAEFTAASLLVRDYRATRGEIRVGPNLNFESIIKRSRVVWRHESQAHGPSS